MYILFFLIAGIFVGHRLRSVHTILEVADKGMMWSVYFLVFFLGIGVGGNQTVIRALGSLGMQALVLSTGGIVGSVLAACFVSRAFFESARHEE